MRRSTLTLFVLIIFLGTACSRYGPVVPEEPTGIPSNTPVELTPTETTTPVQIQEDESSAVNADPTEMISVSECIMVSSSQGTSSEYAELFSVTEEDWVFGPEDAAVTLIEYGDFQ